MLNYIMFDELKIKKLMIIVFLPKKILDSIKLY